MSFWVSIDLFIFLAEFVFEGTEKKPLSSNDKMNKKKKVDCCNKGIWSLSDKKRIIREILKQMKPADSDDEKLCDCIEVVTAGANNNFILFKKNKFLLLLISFIINMIVEFF